MTFNFFLHFWYNTGIKKWRQNQFCIYYCRKHDYLFLHNMKNYFILTGIFLQELSFCHKLKFLINISRKHDGEIFWHFWSNRIHCLKYQRSTTSGCTDIKILTLNLWQKLILLINKKGLEPFVKHCEHLTIS